MHFSIWMKKQLYFNFSTKSIFLNHLDIKKIKKAGGLALSYCSKNSGVGQNKNGPSNYNSDSLNVNKIQSLTYSINCQL